MTKSSLSSAKIFLMVGVLSLSACVPADKQLSDVQPIESERLTVAAAQSVVEGMSGAEVIELLGSPNILTKNQDGGEIWVYDKVSTQTAFSNSTAGGNAGAGAIVGALGEITAGVLGLDARRDGGASATSQRSSSIVVRFSADQTVDSVDYRASRL